MLAFHNSRCGPAPFIRPIPMVRSSVIPYSKIKAISAAWSKPEHRMNMVVVAGCHIAKAVAHSKIELIFLYRFSTECPLITRVVLKV